MEDSETHYEELFIKGFNNGYVLAKFEPKFTKDLLSGIEKNAMPFIQGLGYDVFDPTEVVPEFVADIGIKKGEKIDYAIFKDGNPTILITAD